jgi:hypothetical protein
MTSRRFQKMETAAIVAVLFAIFMCVTLFWDG